MEDDDKLGPGGVRGTVVEDDNVVLDVEEHEVLDHGVDIHTVEKEKDEVVLGLKKTKQGTIRHYLSKQTNFRAQSSKEDGGGSSGGGMDDMVDVSMRKENDKKSCNDSKTKRVSKIKAAAESKRKREAKSKTGKGPRKIKGKGYDSSQQTTLMGFLIRDDQPVGVRNSLGSKPAPTNTS